MMIELLKSQLEASNAANLQLRLTVERMSSSMKSMEVTISELRATIANLESLLQERDNSLSKAPLAPLQNSNYDGSFIAGKPSCAISTQCLSSALWPTDMATREECPDDHHRQRKRVLRL